MDKINRGERAYICNQTSNVPRLLVFRLGVEKTTHINKYSHDQYCRKFNLAIDPLDHRAGVYFVLVECQLGLCLLIHTLKCLFGHTTILGNE